ncbi:MAG TPA: alpha/beta hydrolase-fold protein [Oleiagrimonas sp.]|nr:alpha/beta hydrolase-fold protein [Oleiagrimonas sp.]
MIDLPSSTAWEPLALPDAWATHVRARANDTPYRVQIQRPQTPPPAAGFPLVYVLDGHDLFTGVADTVRRASRRPESTGIAPMVVVGIGHEGDTQARAATRRRDCTPGHCSTETVTGATGGAAAFLDFIDRQLVPMIEADIPVDRARRGLLGHSLSGYFCLWAQAVRPDAFACFAAISPSIWWNPATLQTPAASEPSPRTYLAAGQWEGEAAPWQHTLAADPAGLARRQQRQMIPRTRDLATTLARAHGDDAVHFDLLAGEDHASVVAPAATRALRFMQHAPTA